VAGAASLALLLAGCATAATPESAAGAARVVAIGDLHGDLDATRAVFALAGLIDAEGRWSGGNAVAVQTGDVVDRGPDSRGVLAFLRRLETEASRAGGRLVPLLGNHEAMNVLGDWRYVSPEDLAGYGGTDARRAAYGPEGPDGAWLRARDAVAQVGDTVFVHGGVDARWAARGVDGLNRAVRAALAAGDTEAPVLGPDGPLWNRGLVLAEEPVACPALREALRALGARRMVVGHTTQRDGRVGVRCGGTLHAIDTGISAAYGRQLSALEIRADAVRALVPAGGVAGTPPRLAPPGASSGARGEDASAEGGAESGSASAGPRPRRSPPGGGREGGGKPPAP
jgi:hypothetical protein